MRESEDVSLGRTKSLGGFVVGGGRGFAVEVGGSGVPSSAGAGAVFGLARVRGAIDIMLEMIWQLLGRMCWSTDAGESHSVGSVRTVSTLK